MIFLIFNMLPPRRAMIAAMITAWLFMPGAAYMLPGLPDYSKTSATSVGTLLCIVVFDFPRVLRFRPRWFDLPIVIFCSSVILSSVSNDLGIYDGISQSLRWTTLWGIPYFIGRLYLNDFEGCREFAMGIVIGGLVYIPLCLWEIRFSPQLQRQLYGTISFWEDVRYGSYRPIVFLATGLEVGMWMTAASLCAYWLKVSGVVKQVWGISIGWVVTALIVTTVMCKSIGAIILLGIGILLLELVRWTKLSIFVCILLIIPPLYVVTRSTGTWSGRELATLTGATAGPERQQSLEFRLTNEDLLSAKALQRPFFGWGGHARSFVRNESGRNVTVTDGLWIIILGAQGVVGLASVTALYLLPVYFFYRRFPARLWSSPLVGPAAVLDVFLGLYMLDNLSNAMINPIYAIAAGGLMALSAGNLGYTRRLASHWIAQAAAQKNAGDYDGAEASFGQAVGFYAAAARDQVTPDILAEMAYSYESLADILITAHPDRADEAEACLRRALEFHDALAVLLPVEPSHRVRLAIDFENLGRFLAAHHRIPDAMESWSRALALREGLLAEFPREDELRRHLADSHNDLAWLLANHPGAAPDNLWEAVRQASRAVELEPLQGAYHNTLGAANYHAGDYRGALKALYRSVELSTSGTGTGFDHLLLAMAHARLGEYGPAAECFQQADAWVQANPADHPELARLRDEAAGLLHA
jgi:tetratricopeptide (TPR) repeat protein